MGHIAILGCVDEEGHWPTEADAYIVFAVHFAPYSANSMSSSPLYMQLSNIFSVSNVWCVEYNRCGCLYWGRGGEGGGKRAHGYTYVCVCA